MSKQRGEVIIRTEDGKEYTVRFSVEALCHLEETFGKSFIEIARELNDVNKLSVTVMRKVLWAGLIEYQPNMTLKEAGELIVPLGGGMKVLSLLEEGLRVAFPQADDDEKPGNPPQPGQTNGTGPASISGGVDLEETKTAFGDERQKNLI